MARALLTERLHLKVHKEQQVVKVYALVAVKPRLKAADPSLRATCKSAPTGTTRSYICQNATLDRLVDRLNDDSGGYLASRRYRKLDLAGSNVGRCWAQAKPQSSAQPRDANARIRISMSLLRRQCKGNHRRRKWTKVASLPLARSGLQNRLSSAGSRRRRATLDRGGASGPHAPSAYRIRCGAASTNPPSALRSARDHATPALEVAAHLPVPQQLTVQEAT